MDKQKPAQNADTKSNKISADSNYGSLINESSSSCLSLLSESDLFDDPSTSGCSSEMATMMQSRDKKRKKVKEFLRELKSMVPQEAHGSKLSTICTLDYVVNSMRKITEDQKGQVFKAPSSEPLSLPSLQCPESVDFRNVNDGIILNTQSELTVAVSLKNHVVLQTSQAFMDQLGYPHTWWKGRLLNDFVHKKDVITVNSYINSESSDSETSAAEFRSQSKKAGVSSKQFKQFFYARIRRFRSLSGGFSLSASNKTYVTFKVMVTHRPHDNPAESSGDDQKAPKRCVMLYFAPMISPYKDGQLPADPDQRTFSLRHSLFCNYTYTHANTVALLGHLPQDIVGSSIFDYYHPEDFTQVLDIYKKVMVSSGQPFRSGALRLRTRNGTYVKVTTEWSSFMNPWDHKLEFIIAQHSVVKPPENHNVFEDCPDDRKSSDGRNSEASRRLIEKIKEILQKPLTLETSPPTPSDSGGAAEICTVASPSHGRDTTPTRDSDKAKEKGKNEGSQCTASPSDISSSIIDEKSISSLYNQVNYSLNIKKFLLSHPKAFPVSDEDSSTDVLQKEDSEEDLNEEEEMQVEIPVVRPPSCGSSTQVHVSEQGFHEEVPSPPSFGGEDPSLTREALDNQLILTEDSLRKHTKAQELLYLKEASKEQPHLFHLRSRRRDNQRSRQKRSRPSGHEETTDVFKFARNSKSQTRGSGATGGAAGLFMSSFPMTAVDIKPMQSQPTTTGITTPTPNVVGMMPGPFQPGMGMMPQLTVLPIDPSTGMTLQPFMPTPSSNMQWPYYPQSGYSLLPQVMAGFYQPMLQPVPMTSVTQPSPFPSDPTPRTETTPFLPHPATTQPSGQQKGKNQVKVGTDSDNQLSSAEDTSSSIQYLLDAISGNNSSPYEETDEKIRQRLRPPQKRALGRVPVPPWLQTVQWTPEVRLKYKLPVSKAKVVLKKDREALKQLQQLDSVKNHLHLLLEDAENPDFMPPLDEEADYLFYPEFRTGDGVYTASEGEKTPVGALSPSVTFDLGATDDEEIDPDLNKDLDNDTNQTKDCAEMNDLKQEPPEEVTLTEEPKEEAMNIPEDKALSPVSEGSSVKEGESSVMGEVGSPLLSVKEVKGMGSASDDGRSDDAVSENSSNNSRQKNDDSQSSSSKVSSNLTPSDQRSTEDAGSSIKESDMSTPKGSLASNDKMSTDSGAESASTPVPDLMEKLFVSLRVCMSHGDSALQPGKVAALPFWQREAEMNEDVSMNYNLRPADLSAVLADDRRRLMEMKQPEQVNCQLLELLQEMDPHAHRGETRGGQHLPLPSKPSSSLMQPPKLTSDMKVGGQRVKDCGAGKVGVHRQLTDKLQSLTPGQRSEDWPGDVIVNKVFLSVDPVGGQGSSQTSSKSEAIDILDAVD